MLCLGLLGGLRAGGGAAVPEHPARPPWPSSPTPRKNIEGGYWGAQVSLLPAGGGVRAANGAKVLPRRRRHLDGPLGTDSGRVPRAPAPVCMHVAPVHTHAVV